MSTTDRDKSIVVMESFLHNYLQKQTEGCWRELTSLSNDESHREEIFHLVIQENYTSDIVI